MCICPCITSLLCAIADTLNIAQHLPNIFNSSTDPIQAARIEIPYGIIALLIFGFAFVILGYYIKGPPPGFPLRVNTTRLKDMISPGSCTGGKVIYGLQLFLCLWLYFIQAVGGERVMSKFLFSFAIESDLGISKTRASSLQSTFWLSFTLGRGLGVPIAKFVPLNAVIIGDVIGNLTAAIVLAIWAPSNETILWIFVCFQGLFIAVAFPNGMSWANLRMQVSIVDCKANTVFSLHNSSLYSCLKWS